MNPKFMVVPVGSVPRLQAKANINPLEVNSFNPSLKESQREGSKKYKFTVQNKNVLKIRNMTRMPRTSKYL